ncbi:MAG: LmeA family phospholipid-binding protein [Fimbriimonadaceae bacterium]
MSPDRPILCPTAALNLRGLRLPNGLRIESLAAQASDIALWTDPFRSDLRGGGQAEATVLLSDIAALLEDMAPSGLREFRLAGSSEGVAVEAVRPAVLPVRVRAVVAVEVRDGRDLAARLLSAKVLGANLGRWLESAIERMNPLFSVRDLPVPLRLEEADVQTDRIVLRLAMPPTAYPP